MVDVGSKSRTKRVAVALSLVHLSEPKTFQQLRDNAMLKGDVLSTARVAALMAAKRTSDLIPLCHPLQITKQEVDIRLVEPGVVVPVCRSPRSRMSSIVCIIALVRCFGPTGVEMEALTAASVGALTVYDMVKAVEREARIETRLVYKDGGRSGRYVAGSFAKWVGPDWFHIRGLSEPPEIKSNK